MAGAVTKRHVLPVDLGNLVQANRRFKTAHDAFNAEAQRLDAGGEPDPVAGSVIMDELIRAGVNLFTQSNTVVKLANANEKSASLIVPDSL